VTLDNAVVIVAVRLTVEQRPGLRFDDLVQAVRVMHHDADVCAIDREARAHAVGEPGAYTYEADRQRVLPGMEE
jgi:nucleoside phosphorylase